MLNRKKTMLFDTPRKNSEFTFTLRDETSALDSNVNILSLNQDFKLIFVYKLYNANFGRKNFSDY